MKNPNKIKNIEARAISRFPPGIKTLVGILSKNLNYFGHSSKPYRNKEKKLPGNGPFIEYVAKGKKQRIIVDESTGIIYATLNHHASYIEIL